MNEKNVACPKCGALNSITLWWDYLVPRNMCIMCGCSHGPCWTDDEGNDWKGWRRQSLDKQITGQFVCEDSWDAGDEELAYRSDSRPHHKGMENW